MLTDKKMLESIAEQIREEEDRVARKYDATLELFNLTELQIRSQGLPELKNNLLRIEDIINRSSLATRHILIGRKRLILDRIQELSSYEKIGSIQDLVEKISDNNLKSKLSDELSALREVSKKYQKEVSDITTRETEAKIKLEQHRIDGLERKSKIWLSFLQRESAASIIGGIVLLMLTVALIGGMIFGAESQILSNGFLVILGYFFGQSSSKNKDGM